MSFKIKDHYFNKAKKDGYLARSIYKLEEIDKKFKIFKKNYRVVDFGYHPGSWLQYISKSVGEKGIAVGIDIRDLNKTLLSVSNIRIFQKDIFDVNTPLDLGLNGYVDVVTSDMAPNTTGVRSLDQLRSLSLVEKCFDVLPKFLRDGGHFVIKVFDSHDMQQFLKTQKNLFEEFKYLKPDSTRSTSKEFFVVGKKYTGQPFR